MAEDRPRRVLLVEDDAAIREMVVLALRDEGYAVQVAADGATALHLLAAQPPDVILLDMRMPGTDGWAFAAQYAQQAGVRAPIIVLTAARDAARRAGEIGAAGYLAKPFDLEALLDVVAGHTR
jgi:two-component system chemotaxis response regulator CheY